MKKLMIAAAIALTAAFAQAATVTWSITDVYAGNTTDKASGIAFILNKTTALDTSSWTSGAATLAWLNANALGKDGTAFTWQGSNGNYDMGTGIDPTTIGLVADGATKYQLYAVVFDTTTVTDMSNYFVTSANSKAKSIANSTAETAFSLGTQATASQNPANWTAVSAPEPTSGILLLLGMAGLALKRKRA